MGGLDRRDGTAFPTPWRLKKFLVGSSHEYNYDVTNTSRLAAGKPLNLPDLSPFTLLILDDNDDSLDMLTAFLSACGAQILQARTASGALAYIDGAPKLGAIVTDLAMPEIDGVEFLKKVRAHPQRRTLPVIVLTGFYEDYAGADGFEAFLRKPVDFDLLCSAITTLVERRAS